MALYTPLARLGTFLFPTQSRRISAPAPSSPHDAQKRRSAIAATDSPPRCRRRLSFADTDVVIEYAANATPPALLAAAKAMHDRPPHARPHAWASLGATAAAARALPGLEEPALRNAFLSAFGAAAEHPAAPVEELAAAAKALDTVLSRSASPLSARDEPLVKAILQAAVEHADNPKMLEAVSKLVVGDEWGRVFTPAVSGAAAPLATALIRALSSPQLEPSTWEAGLQLLGVCVEAVERARCDMPPGVGSEVKALQVSRAEAAAVLASFERLADRDVKCTERALRALMPLFADREITATFALEKAGAILSEVSSMFVNKLSVQHACIDLLVRLSSPKVLYFASDV